MPIISNQKKQKIEEHVLYYLFTIFPKQIFTSQIAQELARDEEFIKKILESLDSKGLVLKITKNPKGEKYLKRSRWRLSNKAHELYKRSQ